MITLISQNSFSTTEPKQFIPIKLCIDTKSFFTYDYKTYSLSTTCEVPSKTNRPLELRTEKRLVYRNPD